MGQTIKHVFVEALTAQLAIKALDEAVLYRFSGAYAAFGHGPLHSG